MRLKKLAVIGLVGVSLIGLIGCGKKEEPKVVNNPKVATEETDVIAEAEESLEEAKELEVELDKTLDETQELNEQANELKEEIVESNVTTSSVEDIIGLLPVDIERMQETEDGIEGIWLNDVTDFLLSTDEIELPENLDRDSLGVYGIIVADKDTLATYTYFDTADFKYIAYIGCFKLNELGGNLPDGYTKVDADTLESKVDDRVNVFKRISNDKLNTGKHELETKEYNMGVEFDGEVYTEDGVKIELHEDGTCKMINTEEDETESGLWNANSEYICIITDETDEANYELYRYRIEDDTLILDCNELL